MLGRLDMGIDDCITAFGSLVRAKHDQALGPPPPQVGSYLSTLEAIVVEILVTCSASSAEPFIAATSGACRV